MQLKENVSVPAVEVFTVLLPSLIVATGVVPFSKTLHGEAPLMPTDDHETVTDLPCATIVGWAMI